MKALTLMASLSLCLVASYGCYAGDDESDFDEDAAHDEELAETADAFTGSYGVSLTSTGTLAYNSVNLGNNWQSFFTSIQGNLSRGGQDAYVATRVFFGGDFDLAGLLAGGWLAIANVDAVPAGRYGRAALESLGVWDSVADRIAQAENVRAATPGTPMSPFPATVTRACPLIVASAFTG